ncbi:hypothetical protein [Fundidesulfovibrio agrisoli]|uniref:hypothetical protein n=1 Tax=Fundidesulfovibrio agrisoli TaxID=2922717 RepID=UPI001FAE45FC|nr:hypothetical protein [Fundidesulfovibrio agrisoli]
MNITSTPNILLILLAICFVLEQISCLFPGTFAYKFGITVHSSIIAPISPDSWRILECYHEKLKISMRGDIIYIRRRYPPLTWGWTPFVAVVATDSQGDTLRIKACPVSAVIWLSMAVFSLLNGLVNSSTVAGIAIGILGSLLVIGGGYTLYTWFSQPVFRLFDVLGKRSPQ